MSGNSFLRLRPRSKRWTSSDVVAATERLEKVFTKDKTARAIACMHKANISRGHNLLPVERTEPETLATFKAPEIPAPCPDVFGGFSFRLPWAPSVNQAYFNKTGGGRAKTSKARLFADAAGAELAAQRVPLRKLSHPMAITLIQHTSASLGDVDNGIKLALDVLKHWGVIADDNRKIVKRVTVEDGARVPKGQEHVQVTIAAILPLNRP